MNIHCYGEKYLLYDKNVIELNDTQFKILSLYYETKSIDETVNILIGNQKILKDELEEIKTNVKIFIDRLIENIDDFSSKIKLTGEYKRFYPRILNIELTNFCNFYCGHCYKQASFKNKNFIQYELIENICDKFKGKIQMIHLTGGEPLSHPQINEIINALYKNGFLINITTNGSLIKKLDDKELSMINNFQISLYGYNNFTYELSSKFKNSIEIFNSLKRLENLNIEYDVSFIVNKLYLKYYEDYNKILNKLNYKKIICGFADIQGRNQRNSIWDLSDEEKNRAESYFKRINKYNNALGADHLDEACDAGTLSYCINENGEVYYCQALSNKSLCIGNINDIEDLSIENKFDIIKFVEKNKQMLGGICKYKKE